MNYRPNWKMEKEKGKVQKKITLPYSQRHPFHMVRPSYWPFLVSICMFFLPYFTVHYFHTSSNYLLYVLCSFTALCFCIRGWFRDIVIESTFEGAHTKAVQKNIRYGFILFIVSESMFFFSFFWAFFHASINPSPSIGCIWPPLGTPKINPWLIPLANTAVLLISGATVTFAHKSIKKNARSAFQESLELTVVMAFFFTMVQAYEYISMDLTILDGLYASLFFMLTGFHGLHVIIGTIYLYVCVERAKLDHFSPKNHLGFELAAWYWHFVDIIWILLYFCLYHWGS